MPSEWGGRGNSPILHLQHSTVKSTFFNGSLLVAVSQPVAVQAAWQPARLFKRTESLPACFPRPAPVWTVCCERCYSVFSEHSSSRKQLFVSTGIPYFSCQLICHNPEHGHISLMRDHCKHLDRAGSGRRSTAQRNRPANRHVWKWSVWEKKKFKNHTLVKQENIQPIVLPQCNN